MEAPLQDGMPAQIGRASKTLKRAVRDLPQVNLQKGIVRRLRNVAVMSRLP